MKILVILLWKMALNRDFLDLVGLLENDFHILYIYYWLNIYFLFWSYLFVVYLIPIPRQAWPWEGRWGPSINNAGDAKWRCWCRCSRCSWCWCRHSRHFRGIVVVVSLVPKTREDNGSSLHIGLVVGPHRALMAPEGPETAIDWE